MATHEIAGIQTNIQSESIDLRQIKPPRLVGLDSGLQIIDHTSLIHAEGDTVTCHVRDDYLEFIAPAKSYDESATIYYLAELAAEQKRQLHGGALLHAAGVFLPESGRGLLILGEKGAGKTSTAIGLCKGAGGQLVGNDQIILGSSRSSINLIEGSKDIHIRRTAAIQEPELMSLVNYDDESKPNWDNKETISPLRAGIQEAYGAHEVTDVFQVVIDRTLEETTVKHELNDTQTLLFLVEKISRHIRGVATPITNNEGVFEGFSPSLDTPETSANRKRLIDLILNEICVTKIYAPSTEHVVESIVNSHD